MHFEKVNVMFLCILLKNVIIVKTGLMILVMFLYIFLNLLKIML